jgi:hypothetical protein
MLNASIAQNEISVEHSICGDREFLKFSVPNGWDDVKQFTGKVLEFDGRKFIFSCWNSDSLYCVFYRMRDGSTITAKIAKR